MFLQKYFTPSDKLLLTLAIIFVLSFTDGALTLWGLKLGAIEEANPVMRVLITASPNAFMIVKLLLPISLGLLFWQLRHGLLKLLKLFLRLVLLGYVLVTMLHVYWIITLLS